MTYAIQVKNLSKNYGDFQAVNNLSFSISKGECMGLLGSNGAGKSTTIKILTGQLRPTSGEVSVLGVNPTISPKKIHTHLSYIPERQVLYEDISVFHNIDIFRQLHKLPASSTEKIIDQLELREKSKTKVKNLSKGQRQRVLIARSLIQKPSIVLLDEPTTGLSPDAAESIYKIIEQLKKNGTTILLTTHLMNDVERLCDHIVFLHQGKKVEEGKTKDLKEKYRDPIIEVETSFDQKIEIINVNHDQNLIQNLSKINNERKILSIRSHDVKLEDIFIKLVGNNHD